MEAKYMAAKNHYFTAFFSIEKGTLFAAVGDQEYYDPIFPVVKSSSKEYSFISVWLGMYQDVYSLIMNSLFPEKMIYAKKYESLTVLRQFQPVVYYDDNVLKAHPDWKDKNRKMLENLRDCRKIMGTDIVVTDDRIPKTGLYTIDKHQMKKWGMPYTTESIIDELFYSRFAALGSLPLLTNTDDDTFEN